MRYSLEKDRRTDSGDYDLLSIPWKPKKNPKRPKLKKTKEKTSFVFFNQSQKKQQN